MKMYEVNYFSLICKSYLVLILILSLALRFYAAPPQIFRDFWHCICECPAYFFQCRSAGGSV